MTETRLSGAAVGKGNHIGDTLHSFFNPVERRVVLPPTPIDPTRIARLSIVACGTSFYAALVARYWFERLARLPVDIDVASEYRYRDPPAGVGECRAVRVAVGGDGGYAGGDAALHSVRRAGSGGGERAGVDDGARGGRSAGDSRRPGDRRRFDQGVHDPARGAGLYRLVLRAGRAGARRVGASRSGAPGGRASGSAGARPPRFSPANAVSPRSPSFSSTRETSSISAGGLLTPSLSKGR